MDFVKAQIHTNVVLHVVKIDNGEWKVDIHVL